MEFRQQGLQDFGGSGGLILFFSIGPDLQVRNVVKDAVKASPDENCRTLLGARIVAMRRMRNLRTVGGDAGTPGMIGLEPSTTLNADAACSLARPAIRP